MHIKLPDVIVDETPSTFLRRMRAKGWEVRFKDKTSADLVFRVALDQEALSSGFLQKNVGGVLGSSP